MSFAPIWLLFLVVLQQNGPSVTVKEGNIFFVGRDGRSVQLTAEGLDSDPSLSHDNLKVVFVRRTPGFAIDTGLGDVEENELWIAPSDGRQKPQKILRGHPGGSDWRKDLVVAGFRTPRFSADSRRIYFVATTWATSPAVHVLDIASGMTHFLESGHSVEPIYSGPYRGYLIINRNILPKGGGRYSEYWLYDPAGRRLKAIGQGRELLGVRPRNS